MTRTHIVGRLRIMRTMRIARMAAACAALLSPIACGAPEPRMPAGSTASTATLRDSTPPLAVRPGESSEVATPRPILLHACVRDASAAGAGWSLTPLDEGLVRLDARPLGEMAARDSARLAVRLARAVDALPSDTGVADFRGLPVVVRDAWSVTLSAGDTAVVAFVERRLPMESNPLEEAFVVVAVPGVRQGVRDPLIEQWYVREVGREEMLDPRDLVAAVARPDARASLLFVRDRASGMTLEIVTRADGVWTLEWSGPIARCG
ncbi:MAG: hypothetical protein OEW77_01415 [Gemmatimonadota bacterium]|nr:hypothetical protein [Gemmatimonadota bacterium]